MWREYPKRLGKWVVKFGVAIVAFASGAITIASIVFPEFEISIPTVIGVIKLRSVGIGSSFVFLSTVVWDLRASAIEMTRLRQAFGKDLKTLGRSLDDILRTFGRDVQSPEPDLLLAAMRLGAFDARIDGRTWLKYCEHIRHIELDKYEKISRVLRAVDKKIVEVTGKRLIYDLMYELLRRTAEDGEHYYATTTLRELQDAFNKKEQDPSAYRFLFQTPTEPAFEGVIWRVVILGDDEKLHELEDGIKKELARHPRLYYVERTVLAEAWGRDDPPNCGVYGRRALGMYDEGKGVNVLNFAERKEIDKLYNFFTDDVFPVKSAEEKKKQNGASFNEPVARAVTREVLRSKGN